MSKDIFGLTADGFQKRLGAEKLRVDGLKKVFSELLDQIRYTAEDDDWHRVVIFSTNSSTLNGLSYAERSTILYYLRRHPNIISKLSDKEKRYNALDSMKPYVFKWVDSAEKNNLGMDANYFRHMSKEEIKNISVRSADKSQGFFVDIFSILEFLLGKKNKTWIEMSVYNISAFSGVPMENTRAALSHLLKMRLIVMAYVPCEGRKARWRMNTRVTFTEDEYNRAVAGEGINAKKIVTGQDVRDENFDFTVIKYFYNAVEKVQEAKHAKRIQTAESYFDDMIQETQPDKKVFNPPQVSIPLDLSTDEVEKVEDKKNSEVEQKNLPAPNYPPINIVMPELPGLENTLNDIKSCITSFTNIAESMHKSEGQKYELLKNIIQTNVKQREEYDDLYNQMVAMKKILNQKDRDKDNFVKAIQDALNMMMGKIISATDEFSKIPRHLMDEQKLQAHKAEVIQITVQTAEEIRKLAN